MQSAILAPAAVLVAWSLIVLFWMGALRLPALAKLKLPAEKSRGGRGSDLDGVLPGPIQWKAHNYNHLMEQPTIFYALVAILAITGAASEADVMVAWGYVVLRVAHSLWQGLVNTIPVRLALFTLGSLLLIVLTISALRATL